MDPLLLEALRFGVAILAGGIVAVIAQRIAFRHAQQLQRGEARRRHAAVMRALEAEIMENIHRLDMSIGRMPLPVERRAWDLAREIEMSESASVALQVAYAAGAEVGFLMATVEAHLTANRPISVDAITAAARRARDAFEAARATLRPLA